MRGERSELETAIEAQRLAQLEATLRQERLVAEERDRTQTEAEQATSAAAELFAAASDVAAAARGAGIPVTRDGYWLVGRGRTVVMRTHPPTKIDKDAGRSDGKNDHGWYGYALDPDGNLLGLRVPGFYKDKTGALLEILGDPKGPVQPVDLDPNTFTTMDVVIGLRNELTDFVIEHDLEV